MKELKFIKEKLYYVNLESIEKIYLAIECNVENIVEIIREDK